MILGVIRLLLTGVLIYQATYRQHPWALAACLMLSAFTAELHAYWIRAWRGL